MTYLELCQRLRAEAGISGTGPISVLSQTGEMKQITEWVNTAYADICNSLSTWQWLRYDFNFISIIGINEYTPTSVNLTDLAEWKRGTIEDITLRLTDNDEQYLTYLDWDTYKGVYNFGSARNTSGRPTVFSIKPDNTLILHPIPDNLYTVSGEYYKNYIALVGNTDTPMMPARFHMIIVWRALMLYGAFVSADEKYQHGQIEYKKIMRQMLKNQTPTFQIGRTALA